MSKPRDRKMSPNPRTKPTVRELGPRDPGPHGETVALRRAPSPVRLGRGMPAWMQLPPSPEPMPAEPPKPGYDAAHVSAPRRAGKHGGQR